MAAGRFVSLFGRIFAPIVFCVVFFGAGCDSGGGSSSSGGSSTTVLNPQGCTGVPSGISWVPNVSNASSANHDSTVTVSTSSQTVTAPLSGQGDSLTGREVTITFTVGQDLGENGSVTLLGQISGYPSGISAVAYPLLTYLSDGTNEYINLARGGAGDCSSKGFYSCSGSSCTQNAGCTVAYPSAYTDIYHYLEHQVPPFGYESVNTFPTCRWTEGDAAYSLNPKCAFNTYLAATSGHLPTGTYTARYFLMTTGYQTIATGNNAQLKVTIVQKKEATSPASGAVDINVILVGSNNITASHTTAGQRNLNTLFYDVGTYLDSANAGIKLGAINVYELTCASGGEALSTITSSEVGTLLQTGSALVESSTQGKAINVFLISDFSNANSILGEDGAIGAPPINGLQTSGLTVATFNQLANYNSTCASTPCAANTQDSDFFQMGVTISHEMGHFLGLNHPSESQGTIHDIVYDTPYCTAQDSNGTITINSCLNNDSNVYAPSGHTCNTECSPYNNSTGTYCPAVAECEFNYMMWWSSKHFFGATGASDGNMFSADQGAIMNFSSYVQ